MQTVANPNRFKTAIEIIFLCVGAAIVYGILHDQITVRVCREYFTIGHPLIFGDQPSTVLALLWGIAATWWMGLFLGIILALTSTCGLRPVRAVPTLVRPILRLLATMAASAFAAGIAGYWLAACGWFSVDLFWEPRLPDSKRALFLADLFAHNASYLVGFFGGLALAVKTWRSRKVASVE